MVAERRFAGRLSRAPVRVLRMKSDKRTNRQVGFTLVELLVSIAVVAVLAAMVAVLLPQFRERGLRASCGNNIRQQLAAMRALSDDAGGKYYWNASASGDDSAPNDLYPNYISSLDVFVCPATNNMVRDRAHPLTRKNPDLENNARNRGRYYGHSYEYFGFYTYGGDSVVKSPRHERAMPERVVLVLDGDDSGTNNYPDAENNHGTAGWNWGFADGHVEWVTRGRTLEYNKRTVVRE